MHTITLDAHARSPLPPPVVLAGSTLGEGVSLNPDAPVSFERGRMLAKRMWPDVLAILAKQKEGK